MSYHAMAEMMQMDDTAGFGKLMLDQLEWRGAGGISDAAAAWDAQGWYGGDYNKLWLKTEGNEPKTAHQGTHEASLDLLWNRVLLPWWSLQAGVRRDFGTAGRAWAALGIQGLAPQWLDTEATVYLGDGGRTAARVKAQYDLLMTQRLILQPFAELNAYGRSQPARELGSGVSDVELSLRLRYELRREIAPYIGLVWLRRIGSTQRLLRSVGEDAGELQVAAGVHAWL